jgi:hypothetical protein
MLTQEQAADFLGRAEGFRLDGAIVKDYRGPEHLGIDEELVGVWDEDIVLKLYRNVLYDDRYDDPDVEFKLRELTSAVKARDGFTLKIRKYTGRNRSEVYELQAVCSVTKHKTLRVVEPKEKKIA